MEHMGAGEFTIQFFSRRLGTSLAFTCIKSEFLAHAQGGGGGVSRGFK